MLKLAAVMGVLAAPALAQMPVEIEEPLLELLDQYGTHVGSLSACNRGPGKAAIQDQAAKIGDWRMPGFWAGISGSRADYVEKISTRSELKYSLAAIRGCTGSGQLAANLLISEIETAIDRYTE